MLDHNIGFIGGGNMAGSLIGGLIEDGFAAERLWVSDVDGDKLARLRTQYAVKTGTDNTLIAANVQVLILAVKPQMIRIVVEQVRDAVAKQEPLVISIAAGIRVHDIERWLGGDVALVRCMPNTPALVRTGATALYANARVSETQRDVAESIMRAVGLTVWIDEESLLDVVTALSGSGPAYFFLLMEAMECAAMELGLDRETARILTQQTGLGAARLAIEADEAPAELRRRVTSPGGTTQRAVEVFEKGGWHSLVADALRAAKQRSIELSNELGGN